MMLETEWALCPYCKSKETYFLFLSWNSFTPQEDIPDNKCRKCHYQLEEKDIVRTKEHNLILTKEQCELFDNVPKTQKDIIEDVKEKCAKEIFKKTTITNNPTQYH